MAHAGAPMAEPADLAPIPRPSVRPRSLDLLDMFNLGFFRLIYTSVIHRYIHWPPAAAAVSNQGSLAAASGPRSPVGGRASRIGPVGPICPPDQGPSSRLRRQNRGRAGPVPAFVWTGRPRATGPRKTERWCAHGKRAARWLRSSSAASFCPSLRPGPRTPLGSPKPVQVQSRCTSSGHEQA